MKHSLNQGFSTKWIVIGIGTVIILIVLVFGFKPFLSKPLPQSIPPETTNTGNPTEKVTDLAPGVSNDQKTTIIIMHSDSSYEKFILPKSAAADYVKNLPTGDKVVPQIPSNN